MTDSFVLVASVLAALAFGIGISATLWWLNSRRGGQADASATVRISRTPQLLLVVAVGLLASVGLLYLSSNGGAARGPSQAAAPATTAAVAALAASLNVGAGGASPAMSGAAGAQKGGDLDQMTERLAKRLRENTPDDQAGWALLARSYLELGRDSDAVSAFERTGALLKSDPALKSEYDAAKLRAAAPPKAGAATANTSAAVSTEVGRVVVSGTLDVGPALKASVPKTGFLFIIARTEGQAGAPLAVRRMPLAALPMSFTLSESDSMMPGQKLAELKSVTLSARVSESGDATPTAGALESAREVVAVGRKDVALLLTSRRQ